MGKLIQAAVLSTFAAGCAPESEALSCLNDAAKEQSSAVLEVEEATSDCVTFTLKSNPADGNGMACFAIENGSAWDLKGSVLPSGEVQYCGLNGATDISCVETSPSPKNEGKIVCEAEVTIEE